MLRPRLAADELLSAETRERTRACSIRAARRARHRAPAWRTRAWAIVGALSVTQTVSWGILYYAFAVFLVPMQHDLGFSAAQLTGAFSLALLVSGASPASPSAATWTATARAG